MRKQVQRILMIFGIAFLCLLSGSALGDSPLDILVITNKNVASQNRVDLNMLKAIFVKDVWFWREGGKINAINARDTSDLRAQFRLRVLNWTRDEEVEYWQDLQVSRGIVKPPVFKQPLRAVFAIKGSIGYVYRKDFHENVARVVLVLPAPTAKKK